MSFEINMILVVVIIVFICLVIYFSLRKDPEAESITQQNIYGIAYLNSNVKGLMNDIVNQNLSALYLSLKETEKRREQKKRLLTAIRSCAQGNPGEKAYMLDYIKDLLQSKLNINEVTIDYVMPFGHEEQLTYQDKFEILLQIYKQKYGADAFEKLNEYCNFDKEKVNDVVQ